MSGFAVFGDWHGNVRWAEHVLSSEQFAGFDDMYHVGDFGLWTFHPAQHDTSSYMYLDKVNTVLEATGSTLHVVLGNHEDYTMLEKEWVVVDASGERFFDMFPHIRFWPRVHTHVNPATGVTITGVGGAGSIDRHRRVAGVSWWPQEEITSEDVALLKRLQPEGAGSRSTADVLITHDAPEGVPTVRKSDSFIRAPHYVEQYCQRQRDLLREVLDWVKPLYAFHGHWHLHRVGTFRGVGTSGDEYVSHVVALEQEYSAANAAVVSRISGGELSVEIPQVGTPEVWLPKY